MLKPESIKKGVSLSIALSLVAKGLAFLAQLSIVYFFGTGGSTDIYFWCSALIVSLGALSSSVNYSVIIPHGIHLLHGEGEGRMRAFLGSMMGRYLLAGCGAALALACFPRPAAALLSRFDSKVIEANLGIIRLVALSLPSIMAASLLTDICAIYKRFSAVIMVEAMKSALSLAVFLALRPSVGGEAMAWGFLAGSLAQAGVLAIVMKAKLGWTWSADTGPLPGKMRADIAYALLGQLSAFLFTLFTGYLISGFASGVYSAMNCALSLSGLIQTIFLSRISYVIGIYFMDLYSQRRFPELNALFLNYLKPALLGLLMSIPLLAWFSADLVALAFQRGNFHGGDVQVTAAFFRLFVLTLPLVLVDLFVTQLILAAKKIGSSFYLQLLYNFGNILAIAALAGRLGYLGYPVGLLAVRFLYLFALWAYVGRAFAFLEFGAAVAYLAKNAFTLALLAGGAWWLKSGGGAWPGALLALVVTLAAGAWPENRRIFGRLADLARRKLAHG